MIWNETTTNGVYTGVDRYATEDICPMELLIRILIWIFLAIGALFVGIPQEPAPPPPGPEDSGETFENPVSIDEVTFDVGSSDAPQVFIVVRGGHDGCEFPVMTEISQDGNDIDIRIYREMPLAIACPQIYVPYEDSLLVGPLQPGTYTVTVNGQPYTLDI